MATSDARSPVTEPLLTQPEPSVEEPVQPAHAQPSEQTAQQPARSEPSAALPRQTDTLKILAVVLLVVALLVGAAALLSKSGIAQPGGPPPQCRKSAALAVLRQEDTTANALQAANAGMLQLIIWGGKGKQAELVYDDAHVMNLQDRKWHAVQQTSGSMVHSLRQLPGIRNIWKSSLSLGLVPVHQETFQDTPGQLPPSRWKQVTATDAASNSMIMFGGDSMEGDDSNTDNGHGYLYDAWQLSLQDGKATWQELWNTDSDDEAPEPRRAAAGALFTLPNTTTKQLLIHGGRLEAGHILSDLWQATLGAGNVTYQQLWPSSQDHAHKKKPKEPAARKGHSAVALQGTEACMVIFGGRNGIGYFNDVWAYRLSTGVWEEWTPQDNAPAPMGRDHFGAVYDAGHVYIFGGRGGSTYGKSRPLDDLWRFTIASRSWSQLNVTGPAPMARFLFSSDIFYPLLHQHQNLQESDVALKPDPDWLGYAEEPGTSLANPGRTPLALRSGGGEKDPATRASQSTPPNSADSANMSSDMSSQTVTVAERSVGTQENKGPAGAMIVFGGETVQECYLNDVWVLHLNSLMWEQLSKPVACQKRCRGVVEGRL